MARISIGRRLGVGSQGEVYEATVRDLGTVVVKRLGAEHCEEDRARLVHESRLAGAAPLGRIARPLGLAELSGELILVSERARGLDLARLAQSRRPPVAASLAVGGHVAEILAILHAPSGQRSTGFVHRDLHPGNVLVDEDGQVCLVDLGVSAVARGLAERTASGQQVGSLAVLAPEALVRRVAAPSLDVFSLGALLVWLLTGRGIYGGRTARQVVAMASDPRAFQATVAVATEGLMEADLIRSMLAHDPRARPDARSVSRHLAAMVGADTSLATWARASAASIPPPAPGAWSDAVHELTWLCLTEACGPPRPTVAGHSESGPRNGSGQGVAAEERWRLWLAAGGLCLSGVGALACGALAGLTWFGGPG